MTKIYNFRPWEVRIGSGRATNSAARARVGRSRPTHQILGVTKGTFAVFVTRCAAAATRHLGITGYLPTAHGYLLNVPALSRCCHSDLPWGMRVLRLGAITLAVIGLLATQAYAGAPPSGTASQVASAVASSPKIMKVNSTILSALPGAATDTVAGVLPISSNPGCDTISQCVFGSSTSSTTVVLFGDSHAAQWLPALAPVAIASHFKLIVLWHAGCHVADVNVQYEPLGPAEGFDFCTTWLTHEIASIAALHPRLVLLGERTTMIGDANKAPFTTTVWRAGLVSTISQIKTTTTKVATFEDLPWGNVMPGQCLSIHLSSVQSCASPYPNRAFSGQQVAEKNAALDTKTTFIATHQWFCTATSCSPIVGNYVTKWDQGHASASYVQYLTSVIAAVVKPLL